MRYMRLYLVACALPRLLAAQLSVADVQNISSLNRLLHNSTSERPQVSRLQLEDRRKLLKQVFRTNPLQAATLVAKPEDLLSNSLADYRGLLENLHTYTGTVSVQVIENNGGTGSLYRFQALDSPEPLEGYFAPESDSTNFRCGDSVRLDGFQIDNTMLVTQAQRVARATEDSCQPTGEQKVAVLLVNLKGYPDGVMSREDYYRQFFEQSGSLANYYNEMSYGRDTLSGDVFGYYRLNGAFNTCTDQTAIGQAAKEAAQADVDFRSYQRVVVIMPRPSGCLNGGSGTVGCYSTELSQQGLVRHSTAYLFQDKALDLRAAAHELGHNHGLGHSSSLAFLGETLGADRTRAVIEEYGDVYSSMGGGAIPMHFAASQKALLGWLSPGEGYLEVDKSGIYEIEPLAVSGGLKALRLARRTTPAQYVWVEYRVEAGMDKLSKADLKPGVVLRHEDTPGDPRGWLLTTGGSFTRSPLGQGELWRDPYSSLTIQVLSTIAGRAQIAITYELPCATANWANENTFPETPSSIFGLVSAAPFCQWTTRANNGWLTPLDSNKTTTAAFSLAENPGLRVRSGSVTIERQTKYISQSGRFVPPSIRVFSPQVLTFSPTAYTSFTVGIDAPNGIGEVSDVDVLISDHPEYRNACAFRYNLATANVAFFDADGGLVAKSNKCLAAKPGDSRPEFSYGQFFFQVFAYSGFPQSSQVWIRINDKRSTSAEWVSAGTVEPASQCSVSITPPYFRVGGFAQSYKGIIRLNVPSSCSWQVNSDVTWIHLAPAKGVGPAQLDLTIDDSSEPTPRRASVKVNDSLLLVDQLATGQSVQPYVSFLQTEVAMSSVRKSGSISFSSNIPPNLIQASSDSPWFRIKQITRLTVGLALEYEIDENTSFSVRRATISAEGAALLVVQNAATPSVESLSPLITKAGIVNAANPAAPLAAGSWFSIYGSNLASNSRLWRFDEFVSAHLPTVLDAVQVLVAGQPAPVSYISPNQINVLMPGNISPGTVSIQVSGWNGSSAPVGVLVASVVPEFFRFPQENAAMAAAVALDGTLIAPNGLNGPTTPTRPARPGEVIQLFASGLGETAPRAQDGLLVSSPLITNKAVTVSFDSVSAPVNFAGLVGPGLYQVNVTVPPLSDGVHSIRIEVGGALSSVASIPIHQ